MLNARSLGKQNECVLALYPYQRRNFYILSIRSFRGENQMKTMATEAAAAQTAKAKRQRKKFNANKNTRADDVFFLA